MITRRRLIVVILVIAAGLGGYAATVATRTAHTAAPAADSATEALLDWLRASPEQRAVLRHQDQSFPVDLQKLRAELAARRGELAAALGDPLTPAETVLLRVDAVNAASATLEKRVVHYLLSVREHLTPGQQKRLFGLCAETVREGRGRQWRGGRGQDDPGTRPAGGGEPRGGGRGWRGGRGEGMQEAGPHDSGLTSRPVMRGQ